MEARTGRATERPRDQQTPRRSPPCRGGPRVPRPGRVRGRLQHVDPASKPLDLRLCRPIRPGVVLLPGRPAIRPDTRPARSAQEPHRPVHRDSWSDAHECRGRPPPGRPSGLRRTTAQPAIETPPAPLSAAAVDRADPALVSWTHPRDALTRRLAPERAGPGPPNPPLYEAPAIPLPAPSLTRSVLSPGLARPPSQRWRPASGRSISPAANASSITATPATRCTWSNGGAWRPRPRRRAHAPASQ